jgi:nucleoside-diphosphate-sugar epimerase
MANWRESKFRRENRPNPPRITQAQLKFAGLNLDFSIAKARTKLGYSPRILFHEGMKQAMEWFKQVKSDELIVKSEELKVKSEELKPQNL